MQVKQITNLLNTSKTKIITNLSKFNINRTNCKTAKKIKEINKLHYLKQNKMLKLLKVPEWLFINIYGDMKYCLKCSEYRKAWIFDVLYHCQMLWALSATRSKKACRARYVLYWSMLLDLVIGEGLVGRTLVLTCDGTPSRQNLAPSGPQRIDFVLWNQGILRQPVSRRAHWFTSKIEIRQQIGD